QYFVADALTPRFRIDPHPLHLAGAILADQEGPATKRLFSLPGHEEQRVGRHQRGEIHHVVAFRRIKALGVSVRGSQKSSNLGLVRAFRADGDLGRLLGRLRSLWRSTTKPVPLRGLLVREEALTNLVGRPQKSRRNR